MKLPVANKCIYFIGVELPGFKVLVSNKNFVTSDKELLRNPQQNICETLAASILKSTYGTILLTIISLPVFGQRHLTGFYSCKTAEQGFFVTRVQLKNDSTFKYEFSGDLVYNNGVGKYRVEGKKLIHLEFDPIKLDSAKALLEALSGGLTPTQTMKFLYKRNRLYYFHVTTGQVVKKNYLKRRKGRELIFRGEQNACR